MLIWQYATSYMITCRFHISTWASQNCSYYSGHLRYPFLGISLMPYYYLYLKSSYYYFCLQSNPYQSPNRWHSMNWDPSPPSITTRLLSSSKPLYFPTPSFNFLFIFSPSFSTFSFLFSWFHSLKWLSLSPLLDLKQFGSPILLNSRYRSRYNMFLPS